MCCLKNVCITKTSVMKVSTNHFARQEKLGIRAENGVGNGKMGGNTKKLQPGPEPFQYRLKAKKFSDIL